jgi:hypothetical protein
MAYLQSVTTKKKVVICYIKLDQNNTVPVSVKNIFSLIQTTENNIKPDFHF